MVPSLIHNFMQVYPSFSTSHKAYECYKIKYLSHTYHVYINLQMKTFLNQWTDGL